MKFMVQFQLHPGKKNQVADLFELRGPNRNAGVKFLGAWIGNRSDVAFVLVDGEQESLVENVARGWSEHGIFQIHPVVDIEQF